MLRELWDEYYSPADMTDPHVLERAKQLKASWPQAAQQTQVPEQVAQSRDTVILLAQEIAQALRRLAEGGVVGPAPPEA